MRAIVGLIVVEAVIVSYCYGLMRQAQEKVERRAQSRILRRPKRGSGPFGMSQQQYKRILRAQSLRPDEVAPAAVEEVEPSTPSEWAHFTGWDEELAGADDVH